MYAKHLPMCLRSIKYAVKAGLCCYFWLCRMLSHRRLPRAFLSVRRADHIYTYSCSIHGSQAMATTQMPIKGRMDKQRLVHTHGGILFNLEKKGNSDARYDMDEPWRYYAKWNKPDPKRHMLHNSAYRRSLEQPNSQRQKVGHQAAGRGNWGEGAIV